MYLQDQYKKYRIQGWLGFYIWGALFLIMLFCMFSPTMWEAQYISITLILGLLWVRSLYKQYIVAQAKYLNDFLANCKEGYVELRVVAKALGITELKVLDKLALCIKHGMFHSIRVESEGLKYPLIILSSEKNPYVYKVCPHCGAENKMMLGFVGTCEFCGQHFE